MKAGIDIGDRVADFRLADQNGKEVRLSELTAKGPVVLFFYPKDETPGCTKEVCAFRDHYEVFQEAGATVAGISADTVLSHRQFAAKHGLQFLLLSDQGGALRKSFGVPRTLGVLPGRVTYVIDQQSVVRHVFSSQTQIQKHVEEALRIVRSLPRAPAP